MSDKKSAKYGSKYRVVGGFIDRPSIWRYAHTIAGVFNAEKQLKEKGCDGLRVEKWVDGIGYVLHE